MDYHIPSGWKSTAARKPLRDWFPADEVLVCLCKRELPACRSLLGWLRSSLTPLERHARINKGDSSLTLRREQRQLAELR